MLDEYFSVIKYEKPELTKLSKITEVYVPRNYYESALFSDVSYGCQLTFLYLYLCEKLKDIEFIPTNERIYSYQTFEKEILINGNIDLIPLDLLISNDTLLRIYMKSVRDLFYNIKFTFTPIEYEIFIYDFIEINEIKGFINSASGCVTLRFNVENECEIKDFRIKYIKPKRIWNVILLIREKIQYLHGFRIPNWVFDEKKGKLEIKLNEKFKWLMQFESITELVKYVIENYNR